MSTQELDILAKIDQLKVESRARAEFDGLVASCSRLRYPNLRVKPLAHALDLLGSAYTWE
jgi:hypothetical protein